LLPFEAITAARRRSAVPFSCQLTMADADGGSAIQEVSFCQEE
jgi:hypothetical protein